MGSNGKVQVVCGVEDCPKLFATRGRLVNHLMKAHGQGEAEAQDAAEATFEYAVGTARYRVEEAPAEAGPGDVADGQLPSEVLVMFRRFLEEESLTLRQTASLLLEMGKLLEKHNKDSRELRRAYIEVRAKLQQIEKERADTAGTAA
jgi:hypothetical protein